jgi:hypothetical protein
MPQRATRPRTSSHEDILALALTLLTAVAVVLLHVVTYSLQIDW